MTQAEEIAYWQGFDEGRDRDGNPRCRYDNVGLAAAYGAGVHDGYSVRTGQRPVPDLPRPAGAEAHWR